MGHFDEDSKEQFKFEKDIKKAIELYTKARSMNVPRASNNLGVLYINHRKMDPKNPNNNIENENN